MAKKSKKNENLTLEEKLDQALIPNWDEPYKLPENWCWVYLTKGFAQCLDGFRKPVNASTRSEMQGNIPYYGATGQVGWINDYLTNEHLVLLGEDGAPFLDHEKNKAYIINGKAWVNNHAHILKSFYGENSNLYLMHYLNVFNYHGYVNGSTRLKLTQESMNSIPVPLAPIEEQQRIVSHIESLFAKLDEAKEKAQGVIDGFENRKAAILHKAFSGELTVKWRESNGALIENWINQNLSQCCKIGSGGTPSRKNSEYYKGDIPWIKTGEIEWNEVNDSEEKISQDAIENSSAKLYNPGAVLVAMYGMGVTRGRAAILGVQAATNQAVCVLQPQKHLDNRFLFYFFMCNYWAVREQAVGGNQLNLSATIIGKLNINIPSIPEQLEIVRLLDDIISKEEQTKAIAEQVVEKIDAMKKAILARAFRGELGTNNPNEESAVELIKKHIKGTIKDVPTRTKKPKVKKIEVNIVAKSIIETLQAVDKLTPERLKSETKLDIDDFYEQLKVLIDSGKIKETRVDGESYLEAVK